LVNEGISTSYLLNKDALNEAMLRYKSKLYTTILDLGCVKLSSFLETLKEWD
jgi:hypothetical protein